MITDTFENVTEEIIKVWRNEEAVIPTPARRWRGGGWEERS